MTVMASFMADVIQRQNWEEHEQKKKKQNPIWAENINVGRNQPYIRDKFSSIKSVAVGQNIAMNA